MIMRFLWLCPLLLLSCSKSPDVDYSGPVAGWDFVAGDAGGTKFSPLTQITPDNVNELEVAWEYHTGDYPEKRPEMAKTAFSATPILDDGTLYFCSGLSRAFAIDALTGKGKWVYDSRPDFKGVWNGVCRGVALWKSPSETGVCAKRIFMGTLDGRLVGLDAQTGKPCEDFGNRGIIDLAEGMGGIDPGEMRMTSAATVVNDLVIQGALVWDNHRVDSASGVIRAWDVHTGKLRWAFDPVPPGAPSPQQLGAPPEQKFHRGTPNAWGAFSIDHQRNLLFIPFGGTGIDFIGGHRKRFGFDLDYYANSTVALDITTGKPVWHFQTVHHDLWDYDIAAQPVLIDIEKDGRTIPALAQATKIGHLFILNRETGEPVYPVEERAVPQTTVPDEYTSATQPFPTFPKPLHPHGIKPEEAWGFTFYDRNACRKKIASAANEGIFTPPALNNYNIEYPGVAGGQNWGGLAYDPKRHLLVMPQNHVVTYNKLVPRDNTDAVGATDLYLGFSPNTGTPYIVRHEILLSPFGTPCSKPPWGTLMALDLKTGEKAWEIPFGTTRDTVAALSWLPFGINLGLPSAGGPVITDSGLVFIGASMDNYIRAYDINTGEELWRARLPAGGQATPMTYRLSKEGKQFVVIAAGGHSSMTTTLGDTLVAYTLPD